jgi:hypothetical protein
MAQFSFAFVAMGQGDCCIVRCPDGRVVMVDCGRSTNPWGDLNYVNEALLLLRAWVSSQANTVAALILTHPDADHHNQAVDFFRQSDFQGQNVPLPGLGGQMDAVGVIPTVNITDIYLSNAYADNSPLGNYTAAAFGVNVINNAFNTARVIEPTINSMVNANNTYKTWLAASNFGALATPPQPIANKRLDVLTGNTGGHAWSVRIVAGNVPHGYNGVQDGATADNAQSLITLFEINGRKALLCGDATFSTEAFLVQAHNPLLANVELLQVPHHGSAFASSQAFVNLVNPLWGVVSSGFLEHTYRMPRYEGVLERWLESIEARNSRIGAHDIDYWSNKYDVAPYPLLTDAHLQAKYNQWTTNGTDLSGVTHNPSRNFWYLNQPQNGAYGLYQLQNGGYLLYRERLFTAFVMTAQQSHFFRLTDAGLQYNL